MSSAFRREENLSNFDNDSENDDGKGDEATAYNQLKTSLEKGGIVQDTELLHLYDIKINSKNMKK